MPLKRFALAIVVTATVFGASPALGQVCANNPTGFPAWLNGVRAEAAAAGISQNAISALNGVSFDQSIINRDRAQGVFAQTFLEFSDRMVSSDRLRTGARMLEQYAATFASIERDYGVPGPVIVAFWALETDFGVNNGDFNTVSALATLAFDCRRPDEFRPQLLDALRIIDAGHLTPAEMHGAWAGELGQTQFQPTDYLRDGVDYDRDGRIDLNRDVPDVLASTANLLRHHGWQAGQPWLEEVVVTRDLPWQEADLYIQHSRAEWGAWGVTRRGGAALPNDALPASLILPMGKDGPAFLAYPNFLIYLDWNKALVYATTAAYLATRLAGAPVVARGDAVAVLTVNQVRQLQNLLIGQGFTVGTVDGVIGLQTRAAVRVMQQRLSLPADGYPTAELLAAMGGSVEAALTTAQIRELQTLLAGQGFDVGGIDGVIGSRTRAAITAMQQRLGLPADGVPTLALLTRMRAL